MSTLITIQHSENISVTKSEDALGHLKKKSSLYLAFLFQVTSNKV